MSITFISAGTVAQNLGALTPVAGAYAVGDALFLCTGESLGSNTIATPSGWTLLSANVTAQQVSIFGRFAQSTSETIPTINYGGSNTGYGVVLAFRGVDPSFTSVISGTTERSSNNTTSIIGPASIKTPTQSGALIIFSGTKNKTTTSDGTVFTAPSGFTMAVQRADNGSKPACAHSYSIQTTATAIPANTSMVGSIADANVGFQSTMVFIAPAPPPSGGGGPGTVLFPPYKRKTYVFYDQYYPR